MNDRSLQGLVHMGESVDTLSTIFSSALACCLSETVNMDKLMLEESEIKKLINPYLDIFAKYMAINLAVIYPYLFQILQYRKSVAFGEVLSFGISYPSASDIFGLSLYISRSLTSAMGDQNFPHIYWTIKSIVKNIKETEL